MADYEPFLIPVEVIGGKDAENTLKNIDSKLKEISEDLINVGYGADAMKILTSNMRDLSSVSKSVASGISALNKANAQAAKDAENVALAHQKVATEVQKTANAQAKAEMAALKVAQAHEKQAQKVQQAARPYNVLNQQLKEQEKILKDLLVAKEKDQNKIKEATSEYNKLRNQMQSANMQFNVLTGQIEKSGKALKETNFFLASFLGNLGSDLLQRGIRAFQDFAVGVSKAGIELDAIRNTFAAGARGWKQGGEEMAFVAKMADQLGLNLQATYEPYAKFMTSFTRSGGTIAQSRQIFEDLSTAMVSLHLPASRMEGVFVALEQMANKGTVQAEELKRQLSNALPAAFELAAQSMDILPSQLMDLMKKGQVFSKDFLPKFAATVREALGKQIGVAADQFNAHMNRLQSQAWVLQANLGQAFNLALTPVVKFVGQSLKELNLLTGGFLQSAKGATALQMAFVALTASLLPTVAKFAAASKVVRLLSVDIQVLVRYMRMLINTTNILQNLGLVALFTAIAGAVMYCANSVNEAKQKFAEQSVQILDVTNNVVGLLNEYSSLTQITNKSAAQQEAYNRVVETLNSEYPELLEYINTHSINIKNVTKEQAENIATMAIAAKVQEAEKIRIEELNNTWSKFGVISRQAGMKFLLGCQSLEVGIAHVGIAFTQVFTRITAIYSQFISAVTGAAKWVADKLPKSWGFDDWIENAEKFQTKLEDVSTSLWKFGSEAHANLDGALKEYANQITDVETTRIENANKRFKDTLAGLGSEQARMVDSIMSASATAVGLQSGAGSGVSGTGKGKGKSKKGSSKKEKTKWEVLQEQLKQTSLDYKDMLLNSSAYTKEQINQQKVLLGQLKSESEYYKNIESREGVLKITNKSAKQLSDTLINGIFEPLREGETYWSRFKEAGLDALKSVAQALTKQFLENVTAGFTAGWRNNKGNIFEQFAGGVIGTITNLAGKPLQKDIFSSGGGFLNNIWSSLQSAFGDSTSGGVMTDGASSIDGLGQSILGSLNNEAITLTDTLTNSTIPAVTGAMTNITNLGNSALNTGTNILGVTDPALSTAQSIASMAIAAPIAATGMGALASTMTIASTAFQSAAPALTEMASAMASLATSAATAATSMATLAVSTAAESVAKIPYVGGFLAPVAAALTGAAIAAGTAMTGAAIGASSALAGAGQMLGGAMSGIGNKLSGVSGLDKGTSVVPHAKGGIVSSPTMFPMQGGNFGLAGEAGTEVIAPARRMSNGDVGIGAVQPKVVVNNYTNAAVEVVKRPNNEMEIKISELNAMLSSSKTNKGWANAQSRMSKQGKQIG